MADYKEYNVVLKSDGQLFCEALGVFADSWSAMTAKIDKLSKIQYERTPALLYSYEGCERVEITRPASDSNYVWTTNDKGKRSSRSLNDLILFTPENEATLKQLAAQREQLQKAIREVDKQIRELPRAEMPRVKQEAK